MINIEVPQNAHPRSGGGRFCVGGGGWCKSCFVEHLAQRSALRKVLNKTTFTPPWIEGMHIEQSSMLMVYSTIKGESAICL